MTTIITDLPTELLVKVFSFLPGKTLGNVCKTCSRFREAVNIDSIWQARCATEYNFTQLEGWNSSYQDVYTKILVKYGSLIGLYQRDFKPYGGLANIKFDTGQMLVCEYLAPDNPHIKQPLKEQKIFSICINKRGEAEVSCLKGYKGPHTCKLIRKNQKLKFKCQHIGHHRHPRGKEKELEEWLISKQEDFSDLSVMKFEESYLQTGKYKFEPMDLPRPMRNIPIQPGLFKGHYGAHGIEIMHLSYDSEMKNILVLKITGDVNVPAMNVSLFVDLHRPMVLNLEQQESMHMLREMDTPDIPEENGPGFEPRHQPFMIPTGCFNRVQNIPQRCKYRFHGKGRIAGHGYHNPSLTPGHFVVFDDDTLGFMWMELLSFSMYSRVTEMFG
ncbi:F-box only protein 31-like [Mizuhopecten yessoensis]|uniref:F-box only protein 31-A n=1 Tax=Mizuhopecten yessoensis TaxID=6573 RepID=A0A210PN85_MIZYE|nr:F-box only protein 31-like [Mizuhopecten yessoensis]OWF37959.1 F-box only protein 31-A [Mizuhopecten yessoensis]